MGGRKGIWSNRDLLSVLHDVAVHRGFYNDLVNQDLIKAGDQVVDDVDKT